MWHHAARRGGIVAVSGVCVGPGALTPAVIVQKQGLRAGQPNLGVIWPFRPSDFSLGENTGLS